MKSRRASTEREWTARVLRVLDFITEHLADELPLSRLARVGAFSPFHFHRVFQAQTGETVRAFVARKRVERAMLLLGRGASRRRLTDLALELGFSSPAEFSRTFRLHTGLPPSKFRGQIRKKPQGQKKAAPYPRGHVRLATRPEAAWLPGSGCELADAPAEERFVSRPDFESSAPFDVVLSLPVRRR
jgi:AraC-like DNA-binding protein